MYQVLARKYRPRNFIELVGQNHVSRALTSALERGRLHHAYLFTGTRGVGKTTIARILAKCLNCETGVTSTPCEVCPTCRAVNEGRFIDLIEIDAASRTKVEDTRELLDNVPYAPTQGRFKVYLIDEVHMLSTHSFNALLKTLEEPPEHVKFLFATTDPQKLPITVISRCLQFTLRPLAVDEITQHLTAILTKEQINADQDAIWQIAESAQGSLRDALSLTDQAIAYGQGEVHHQDVKEMLGLIDRTIIYDLILAIHQNQQAKVSQLLLQFRQQALDVSLVLDQLISTLHELALLQYLPELALKYSQEINQKIVALSKIVSAQDLQLYYQIACKGREELQLAVTQEQGFEMCVLRLLAFRPLARDEVITDQASFNEGTIDQVSTHHASSHGTTTQHIVERSMQSEAKSGVISTQSLVVSESEDVSIQPLEQTELAQEVLLSDPEISSISDTQVSSEIVEEFDNFEEPAQLVALDHEALETSPEPVLNDSESVIVFDANSEQLIGFETPESTSAFSLDDIQTFPVDESVPASSFDQSHSNMDVAAQGSEGADISLDAAEPDLFVAELPKTSEKSVDLNQAETASPLETVALTQIHVDAVQADLKPENHVLMPQDILKLSEQVLEGAWTLEKWEFWFRNSPLSPAVQELAQYGLMSGQIDGACKFTIPKQYERMLSQLQHALESEIKSQWPNTQFDVQYAEIDGTTPYHQQVERKQKAFQRAEQLLNEDPVIKNLLNTFDGELQNIQLKG
ncbi:DNA polymerase III subunit gamma/tau [Acinetobacter ihumii]|uniref:DNA polymerase III subunit gamma/tau n=1 Tax=Acinetobacter ihumii TaxID=2483802 RepID=UPI001032221A|nr:DNA polymerase III subunit gamma/tau [Acinetobacter ihumii]